MDEEVEGVSQGTWWTTSQSSQHTERIKIPEDFDNVGEVEAWWNHQIEYRENEETMAKTFDRNLSSRKDDWDDQLKHQTQFAWNIGQNWDINSNSKDKNSPLC